MVLYAPRLLVFDGRPARWYYAADGGGLGAHPVGYCSPLQRCGLCLGCGHHGGPCNVCQGRGYARVLDPCRGHKTPAAACGHHRDFLLDNLEFRCPDAAAPGRPCCVSGCDAPARFVASAPGGWSWPVCLDHATRDALAPVVLVSAPECVPP